MTYALSLRGLTKTFGQKTAVNALNLDIPAGSFYGLVGPNGAGKTTTLQMSTGMLLPTSGSVSLFDTDVWSNIDAVREIGRAHV